jgi:hypothetical protein
MPLWTNVGLNDSINLSEKIKDYGTRFKRVLNFDSVLKKHNELINIKKRDLDVFVLLIKF